MLIEPRSVGVWPAATTLTTSPSMAQSPTKALQPSQEPPCIPIFNSKDGISCQCKNKAVIPAATTGTHSGTAYIPCPWSTLPPEALTTPPPPPTTIITPKAQYQYTYTDANKRVIECQSGVVTHRGAGVGDKPVTECQGSTALII